MAKIRRLNLLVIDEDQLYAERLVEKLSEYFTEVNLGFLDDKTELVRLLRQSWDVLIYHSGYQMSFTEVIGILQEQDADIPTLLISDEHSDSGLPDLIEGQMVKSIRFDEEDKVCLAVCLQCAYIHAKRRVSSLRGILSEAETRANVLIKNSKSAVAYIDQGVHVYANDPYLELFGYPSIESITGVPVVDLINGRDNISKFKTLLRRFDKGDRSQVEFDFESIRPDGQTFEAKLQLAQATYEGDPVLQIIIQRNELDASEVAARLAEAERQDNLTGLPNRLSFNETFARECEEAKTGGGDIALLHIAIDNLGKISGALGIVGMDTVIKNIAYAISETFEGAFVARFGDARFMVISESPKTVEQEAEALRERIDSMLIEVGTRTVQTTISSAIVHVDKNAPSVQVVIDRAIDTLSQIYRDTEDEGNKTHVFDISEHASDDEDALCEYLIDALENNRFELLYQPIYDVQTDTSDFFEVYLHLPMTDGSRIGMEKIVPVAQKAGILEKIDRYTLINASKTLAQFRTQNPNARLLIALSTASLANSNTAPVLSQLNKAIGGQPGALVLQFNEQDLVDYLAQAKRQFMALKDIDCPVCIFNYGATAKAQETVEYLAPTLVRLAKGYVKDLERPDNMETVQNLVAKVAEQKVDALMPYIEDAQTMSLAWSVGARYLAGDYLQPPSVVMDNAQEQETQ